MTGRASSHLSCAGRFATVSGANEQRHAGCDLGSPDSNYLAPYICTQIGGWKMAANFDEYGERSGFDAFHKTVLPCEVTNLFSSVGSSADTFNPVQRHGTKTRNKP